ncbi:hypothetical protein PRK78_000754 [Emydomyces testavorans]|uniref:Vacuolar import and degradation protein-domain-containing protein n=1 Tax=Emydomyces testavorans TaxID=2070801 RepID=A0AAF0DC28_9EURO|nr:hypothetical protein PRK78_000754 [Emydomyces testavorans]
MPPANSPSDTPPAVNSPSSSSPFLRQLEFISTPALDLAATLMSPPEDAIHDQNVSFLRSRRESNGDRRDSTLRSRDIGRQLVSDLSGSNNVEGNGASRPETTARSGDRVPLVRRQSVREGDSRESSSPPTQRIYAWAPDLEYEDNDWEERSTGLLDSMRYAREATRASRRTAGPSYEVTRAGSSRTPRAASNEQEGRRNLSARQDVHGDSGLVTTALLQSIRRHPRFSTRHRASQNQTIDNAPTRNTEDADDEIRRVFMSTQPYNRQRSLALRGGDSHRHSEIRRMYLKDPSVDRLKETIQYLDRVRFSNSYEESLSSAAAGGFVHFDYFLRNEDDFILNTSLIAAPAECSWLKPGTVFSGHQQASHSSSPSMLSHRVPSNAIDPDLVNTREGNRITVHTSSGRRYWANNPTHPGRGGLDDFASSKTEHWPVKVTIHDVDYSTMTLSGTMEAYNIPDKTALNQSAHIITFLEGEIIDFNKHTLETKNFSAGPEVDSCYWRELEPFKDQTYDEIVKNLVSKKWLTETLAKGWILMRWKERCFVSPSYSRQGLTISGFYYISIRRDNGHIAGMYYDPGSSPYQQLTLDPIMKDKMVFPAYSFR